MELKDVIHLILPVLPGDNKYNIKNSALFSCLSVML